MTKATINPAANNFSRLSRRLREAQTQFQLWEGYEESLKREDVVRAINAYDQLFPSIARALLTSSIVNLCQLFETTNGTVNYHEVLKSLKCEGRMDDSCYESSQDRWKKIKEVWKKIYTLRNEFVAHQSIKNDAESCFRKAKLTPADIQGFIDESKSIFSDVLRVCKLGRDNFGSNSKQLLNSLLEDIATHNMQRLCKDVFYQQD
jgi:AbiU2